MRPPLLATLAIVLSLGPAYADAAAEAVVVAPTSSPPQEVLAIAPLAASSAGTVHDFWDWQNDALFLGVAGARAFDYYSTRKFRDKHLKEWLLSDEIVDNRPLFVAIEAAGTALSVGVSYALHRTGHHRLERWVSIFHLTFATAGAVWNCTLPNGL